MSATTNEMLQKVDSLKDCLQAIGRLELELKQNLYPKRDRLLKELGDTSKISRTVRPRLPRQNLHNYLIICVAPGAHMSVAAMADRIMAQGYMCGSKASLMNSLYILFRNDTSLVEKVEPGIYSVKGKKNY